MRKIVVTILFLLFSIFGNCQYSSHELLRSIIKNNSIKNRENVVISELDSLVIEPVLKRFESKKRNLKSITDANNKINLTGKEKRYLITEIRKQYEQDWNKEDFVNIKVISKEQLKGDEKLSFIFISVPIFIRNDSVALVFFANFKGNLKKIDWGMNDFSFYKFVDSHWEKWVTLESGVYN